MEPQVKTGIDGRSFLFGVAAAVVGSIAVAILAGRKDKIVYFDGEPHLLVRPITPTGDYVLNLLANDANSNSLVSKMTIENYID
jgi:hypothetical protein